nr:MAG: replication-associated protein [Canine circovirus]
MLAEHQNPSAAVRTFMTQNETYRNSSYRRFFITCQGTKEDLEQIIEEALSKLEFRYACVGYENAPTTGQPHAHVYIALRKNMRPVTIKSCFSCKPDVEGCRGTEQQNIDYVKKGGDFYEWGEPLKNVIEKMDRDEKMKQIMNDWLNDPKDIFEAKHPYEAVHWRSKLSLWESQRIVNTKPWDGDLKLKNFWIFGAPGTGKSRWARKQAEEFQIFPKPNNKWWGGYDQNLTKIVLFEDFPVDGKYLSQYLKIWADRYSFIGEIKGGAVRVDPGKWILIVTSNFAMDEIFDGEDLKALKRRFHEVEIKSSEDVFLQTQIDLAILN